MWTTPRRRRGPAILPFTTANRSTTGCCALKPIRAPPAFASSCNGKPWIDGAGLRAAVFDDPWGSWGGPETDPTALDFSTINEAWKVTDVRVIEKGPWRAAVSVRLAGKNSHLDLTLRLYSGGDSIEVLARIFWNERLGRLKLILPLGEQADFEVPGGQVQRGPRGEVPGGRWPRITGADAPRPGSSATRSITLIAKTTNSAPTIVRATRYAYGRKILEDFPWLPTLDTGELKFTFELTPGNVNLVQRADRLEQPVITLPGPAKPGPLTKTGSLMSLEPATVRLLALKPALDGNGWIVRMQELAGLPTQPTLTLLGQPIPLHRLEKYQIASYRLRATGQAWAGNASGPMKPRSEAEKRGTSPV